MSDRFYADTPVCSHTVRLMGAEAHHLLNTTRHRAGDVVRLFDGSGQEFECRIISSGKDWAELKVESAQAISRELRSELTLAVALPKGDRQHVLVEKLVEIGVTTLIPLITERGVAKWTTGAADRLQRYVVEASKQCGRNVLMRISEAIPSRALFAQFEAGPRLIAQPKGTPLSQVRLGSTSVIAVGPEGGFTDSEVEAATKAGWQHVDLGPRTLRVETAAIALAVWAGIELVRA